MGLCIFCMIEYMIKVFRGCLSQLSEVMSNWFQEPMVPFVLYLDMDIAVCPPHMHHRATEANKLAEEKNILEKVRGIVSLFNTTFTDKVNFWQRDKGPPVGPNTYVELLPTFTPGSTR